MRRPVVKLPCLKEAEGDIMQKTVYKVLASVWYTPPLPGTDVVDMVALDLPQINIGVVAIASGPADKNWKAYLGLAAGYGEIDDEQMVATNGVKITKEVACAHFPQLSPEEFIF